MNYTELQVTSNFTFLRGASHPEELIEHAATLGYKEIAIADKNSLAGIVRAHVAAKAKGIRMITGCRLDLKDGASLLAYPTNKDAYSNLCELLTKGNLRTEKGECDLYKHDVYEHAKGIKFIAIPPLALNEEFDFNDDFKNTLAEYHEVLGSELYLGATRYYQSDDLKKFFRLSKLSQYYNIPLVATNDVYYHNPERRELQDILTCIREKCTIFNAGYLLHENAERYLKPVDEMHRLFRQYSIAIKVTQEIGEACQFSLDSLEFTPPHELSDDGKLKQETLEQLTWEHAKKTFGETLPDKITKPIKHELSFIKNMNYAHYFLQVFDFVNAAKELNILCQGRGSAANSTVCYCLGITAVNPEKYDLLFERFISAARNEPPDIDVDFEHERREEVIQYIYNKYGRDRAGIVATVTMQRQKGALRDVGRAMGLSVDTLNRLSKCVWEFSDEFDEERMKEHGIDAKDSHFKKILQLTKQYLGFPRQLGQHTGGFVITQEKLSSLCPVLNARMKDRTCIEWNKDDIDAVGFPKTDVLGLGILTCIHKCFDLAKEKYGLNLTLTNIPQDDPAVYEMASAADTIGVFQIESRAQQSMLPRLKPTCFYDLVIEVAIVRPGPIQGDMVHPYLRRRNGKEPVEYPSPEMKEILGRTLGVPLFQEQAMRIAEIAAGFTPTEADALRKSMATFKLQGMVTQFQEKLMSGMLKNGYSKEYAERIFKQLEGFGSYGFPESHAVSFANLVYVSAWIKCYYPDVFTCGLLNSLPMGFYAPAQIITDARKHDVQTRPIDINYSLWDNTLEEKVNRYHALRIGFRQIKGIHQEDIQLLTSSRKKKYTCINEILDAGVSINTLEQLADADAFRSIGLDRREALWEITSLRDSPFGLFKGQVSESINEDKTLLPKMSDSEHVVYDYASTSFSLKAHPLSFIREKLKALHAITLQELKSCQKDDIVRLAGNPFIKQRPGTAKGMCFISLEDEFTIANLAVYPTSFAVYTKEILHSQVLMVTGKVQVEDNVMTVLVHHCENWTGLLKGLTATKNENISILVRSPRDENDGFPIRSQTIVTQKRKKVTQEELFPEARNFK